MDKSKTVELSFFQAWGTFVVFGVVSVGFQLLMLDFSQATEVEMGISMFAFSFVSAAVLAALIMLFRQGKFGLFSRLHTNPARVVLEAIVVSAIGLQCGSMVAALIHHGVVFTTINMLGGCVAIGTYIVVVHSYMTNNQTILRFISRLLS